MPQLLTVILVLLALASGGCSLFFFAVLGELGAAPKATDYLPVLAGLVLCALFLWLAYRRS